MSSLFGVNRRDFPFDETKFKPNQREAAIKLIEREFAPKDEKKSKTQIAEELGISRMTLHNWETRDSNFKEYRNYLAQDFVNGYLPFVYSKLIEGIDKGSMRGIELYLKRIGDLDSRSEVTINNADGSEKTHDERKAELLQRLKGEAGGEAPEATEGDTPSTKDD